MLDGRIVKMLGLLDSGNTLPGGVALSERAAKSLKLDVLPCANLRVQTAHEHGRLEVIGLVRDLRMAISSRTIINCSQVLVIKSLSSDVNLGLQWLRSIKAEISYKGAQALLQVQGESVPILGSFKQLVDDQRGRGAPPEKRGHGAPPEKQGRGAPSDQRGHGAPPEERGHGAPPEELAHGAATVEGLQAWTEDNPMGEGKPSHLKISPLYSLNKLCLKANDEELSYDELIQNDSKICSTSVDCIVDSHLPCSKLSKPAFIVIPNP